MGVSTATSKASPSPAESIFASWQWIARDASPQDNLDSILGGTARALYPALRVVAA